MHHFGRLCFNSNKTRH